MARDVRVAIIGDPSSLQRALRTADTGVARFGQRMQTFGTQMRSFGASMTRNLTLPLVGFGVLAWRELSQGERALAQTEAVIESTGGAARRSVDDIVRLSQSLSELTSIDDEPIQEAANTLLTFREIAGQTFDEATAATLDLSVAMDRDLRSSAVMVGRALNDPIRGMQALTRVGVQFDERQREWIEHLVESGDVMGAQRVILAELNAEFGGSAEALGETLSGRLNRVKNQMEAMGASILENMMPALEDLTGILTSLANGYADLTPTQQKYVAGAVALLAVIGPLSTALGAVATALGAVAVALGVSTGLILVAILAIAALGVALYLIVTRWNEIKVGATNALNNIRANVPGASAAIAVISANLRLVIGYWQTVARVARVAIGVFMTVGRISFGALLGGLNAIRSVLDGIVSAAQSALSLIRSVAGGAGGILGGVAGVIAGAGESSSFIPSSSPSSSGAPRTSSAYTEDFARSVARELSKTVQPVIVVGG